jgi:hypothetical protein
VAEVAQAAPNRNPIVVFVMSLFATASMSDDRIAQTDRAVTQDRPASCLNLIGFKVVLCRRK